jgi:hypothetical protein
MRETKFLPSRIPKSQSIINRHAGLEFGNAKNNSNNTENSAKCRQAAILIFGFWKNK